MYYQQHASVLIATCDYSTVGLLLLYVLFVFSYKCLGALQYPWTQTITLKHLHILTVK